MILLRPRSAISTGGGGGSPSGVVLDVSRAPTGYTYSDGDRKVVNTTAGSNQLNKWAISASPIPNDGTVRYWEVHLAGGAAQYNGYIGVITEPNRDGGSGAGSTSPVAGTSVGYRGDGNVWSGGATVKYVASTETQFGAGKKVMIAFRCDTGAFWCGCNGTWSGGAVPGSTGGVYSTTPGAFYAFVQGRDPNEGGFLRSIAGEFSYNVPSGTVPLGA